MNPPGSPPPRARIEHSSATMALARIMYGDGDEWTPTQIARYITDTVRPVHVNTVRRWVFPGWAAQQREQNRQTQQRRRARERGEAPPPATLLDRMSQLKDAGVTLASIAAVIELDEGVSMTAGQVRYYLRTGREPRMPKRRAQREV